MSTDFVATQTPQQPVFFLDTKSTCFLFFSEIGMGDAMKNQDSRAEQNGDYHHHQFNMQVIYKYLALQVGKLFGTIIPEETDLIVRLCGSCERKTEMLSKLCLELEQVQMKVHHWLKQVHDTMKKSENDQERILKFQSTMTQPLDMFQMAIMDVVRKDMESRCSKRLEETKASSLPVDAKENAAVTKTIDASISIPAIHVVQAPIDSPAIVSDLPLQLPPNQQITASAKQREPETDEAHSSTTMHLHGCATCGKKFSKRSGYLNHLNQTITCSKNTIMHHKRFACKNCGASYAQKTSLNRHCKTLCPQRHKANEAAPLTSPQLQENLAVCDSFPVVTGSFSLDTFPVSMFPQMTSTSVPTSQPKMEVRQGCFEGTLEEVMEHNFGEGSYYGDTNNEITDSSRTNLMKTEGDNDDFDIILGREWAQIEFMGNCETIVSKQDPL